VPSPILPLSLFFHNQSRFLAPFLPTTDLSSHASYLSLCWSRGTTLQTRIMVQITQISNASSNHFSQLGTQLAPRHFDPGPTHSQAYKERQSSRTLSSSPEPQPPTELNLPWGTACQNTQLAHAGTCLPSASLAAAGLLPILFLLCCTAAILFFSLERRKGQNGA